MVRATVAALPAPYSKRAHTFRTAGGDSPAARARLGSPSFIGLDKARSVPAGFVTELASEHRPACIQNGLRHSGFRKFGRVHIADDDQCVLPSKTGRLLVKVVAARVGDLGVDRLHPAFIPGSLRYGERGFILAVMPQRGNSLPVAARSKVFQAKVNTNRAIACRTQNFHVALKCDVPAASRVLNERPGADLAAEFSRLPEMEFAFEVCDSGTIDFNSPVNKRNKAKGTFCPATGAEPRATPVGVAGYSKLAANRRHRIRVQPQFGGNACRQLDQVKGRRPPAFTTSLPATFGFTLSGDAEVPHLINRPSMAVQVLSCRRVLDAVFKRQHHAEELNWSAWRIQVVNPDYRRERHSVTKLVCHLVFVTKYRRKVFDAAAIEWLAGHFAKVCETMGCRFIACDGEADHIHLMVEYPPKHSVSVLVNAFKGTSSRLLRQARPDIASRYWKGVLWSPSYFAASAGGAPLERVKRYVEEQRLSSPSSRTGFPDAGF